MNEHIAATLERIRTNIEKQTENRNTVANKDPDHDLSDNTVTKQHALSRAYYRFGLVEKRCMEAMISQLHPMRQDNIQEINLCALDYAKTFSVSEKTAYRDLEKAVNGLIRTVISTKEDQNGRSPNRVEFTLMSKATYIENQGCIVCVFNPLIVPYLIGLKERFSSYPLKNAVDFSSSYTWRFYELLVSWAKPKSATGGVFVGWFNTTVDELRDMLGVPTGYNWTMFNKRVLNVAENELLEKSHIYLKITRQKTNRRITHLKIEFIEAEKSHTPDVQNPL